MTQTIKPYVTNTGDEMFEKYYHQYLTYDKNKYLVVSEQRRVPLNGHYYYPIIGTTINDKPFYSIDSDHLSLFKYDISNSIEENIKFNHEKNTKLRFRHFYRMSVKDQIHLKNNKAKLFDLEDLKRLKHKVKTKDELNKLSRQVKEKRKFVVWVGDEIASIGRITDIDFNGGNIAVYTKENHRGMGYGKMVVEACINWCTDNEVVPIYLVDSNNGKSVSLAKSLGFVCHSEEFVLSIEK